jgi:hypothetical protein
MFELSRDCRTSKDRLRIRTLYRVRALVPAVSGEIAVDVESLLAVLRRRVEQRLLQYNNNPHGRDVVAIKYGEALAALRDVEKSLGLEMTPGVPLRVK